MKLPEIENISVTALKMFHAGSEYEQARSLAELALPIEPINYTHPDDRWRSRSNSQLLFYGNGDFDTAKSIGISSILHDLFRDTIAHEAGFRSLDMDIGPEEVKRYMTQLLRGDSKIPELNNSIDQFSSNFGIPAEDIIKEDVYERPVEDILTEVSDVYWDTISDLGEASKYTEKEEWIETEDFGLPVRGSVDLIRDVDGKKQGVEIKTVYRDIELPRQKDLYQASVYAAMDDFDELFVAYPIQGEVARVDPMPEEELEEDIEELIETAMDVRKGQVDHLEEIWTGEGSAFDAYQSLGAPVESYKEFTREELYRQIDRYNALKA